MRISEIFSNPIPSDYEDEQAMLKSALQGIDVELSVYIDRLERLVRNTNININDSSKLKLCCDYYLELTYKVLEISNNEKLFDKLRNICNDLISLGGRNFLLKSTY